MALIECSECGKEVSEKAAACPSCGNPISEQQPRELRTEKVGRTGGAYEGVGFLLIVIGMLSGMMGAASGIAWTVALAGIVIFIIGRFN